LNAISLIVRGDDFGLCHASNQAICEAFETGLLTCVSLVVTTPWLAEARRLAQQHPEWEIGLQLSLHCSTDGYRWGPLSGARTVPSLSEPDGTFSRSLSAAAQPKDIADELDAQVERAQACGIRPAYLEYDGADHPAVEASLQRLSERLGAPARMTAWGVEPAVLCGSTEKEFDDSLAALKPGTYFWVTHPAHASPETWALWDGTETAAARYTEAQALCSAELRWLLDQRGIERISFRQHLEERLGTETEE
jgi:chitin disaccharide deacetylase